jgi:hypothetical protein
MRVEQCVGQRAERRVLFPRVLQEGSQLPKTANYRQQGPRSGPRKLHRRPPTPILAAAPDHGRSAGQEHGRRRRCRERRKGHCPPGIAEQEDGPSSLIHGPVGPKGAEATDTLARGGLMLYRILADGVMVVHFAFIIFVAIGALLAWRWPALVWVHLPALVWGIATVTIGFPCPLTAIEKGSRRLAGSEGYEGGFVDHYLEDVIYPARYSSMFRALAVVTIVAGYGGLRRKWYGSIATCRPSGLAADA